MVKLAIPIVLYLQICRAQIFHAGPTQNTKQDLNSGRQGPTKNNVPNPWNYGHATKPRSKNQVLADKVEKLLHVHNNSHVEEAKIEIEKRLRNNFVRILSIVLLASKPESDGKTEDKLLQVMRQTLNGGVDFMPVVHRLPVILREPDDKAFWLLVRTVDQQEEDPEGEVDSNEPNNVTPEPSSGAQNTTVATTPASRLDKILDAALKININEIVSFLKEIPSIFEGIQAIIDGVDEFF